MIRARRSLFSLLVLLVCFHSRAGDAPSWPNGTAAPSQPLAQLEASASPEVSVVASLVGDRDDFGFGGLPKVCSSFDHRTADDHPAFDVSAPGGNAQGCQFTGEWQHTFPVPPGGVAHFAIRIPEVFADDGRFGCNFQDNAERMTIDGWEVPAFLTEAQFCEQTNVFTQGYWGQDANRLAGDGQLNVWYTQGGDEFALDYSEIVNVWGPVEVKARSGNHQTGVVGSPVEFPVEVELDTQDPDIQRASVPITFELLGPRGFTGGGLTWEGSLPDTVGPTTTTITARNDGRASVRVVLGDKEGAYTVRVTSGMSLSGVPAEFTLTAKKPASVRIIKDAPDTAYLETSYAVSSVDSTAFYAVGLDAQGQKIGVVRSTWTAKGGRTGGSATLQYSSPDFPTSTNVVTPTKVGLVDLTANPVVSGIRPGTSQLFIVGVVLSLTGEYDPLNPQNHLSIFTPGSTITGASYPLPANEADPIQRVNLFVETGVSRKGRITVTILDDVSKYPGVAMNYPPGSTDETPDFTLSRADDLAAEGSSIGPEPFGAGGVSTFILNVRDYGANGRLQVKIENGRDAFTFVQRLPVDRNGNGIPDRGWRTASAWVLGSAYVSDEDLDQSPPAFDSPLEGLLGDGLTALEEYRGVISVGTHRRLHPEEKDLFLVVDTSLMLSPVDALTTLPKLPQRLWYLNFNDEVVTTSDPDPALSGVKAVVNSNRRGFGFATEQRAVRLRYRADAPIITDVASGQQNPADFVAAGYTFVDPESLLEIRVGGTGYPLRSPNGTQVSEFFPGFFENQAISYGQNGIPESLRDSSGNLVRRCTDFGDSQCSYFDDALQVVRKPANDLKLWAVPGGDDYYTKLAYKDCPIFKIPRVLTREEFDHARALTVVHEATHALRVRHTDTCGEIMFTRRWRDSLGKLQGVTVLDYVPLPSDFSFSEEGAMRLHENL